MQRRTTECIVLVHAMQQKMFARIFRNQEKFQLQVPLEVCEARDTKGLYKLAR